MTTGTCGPRAPALVVRGFWGGSNDAGILVRLLSRGKGPLGAVVAGYSIDL